MKKEIKKCLVPPKKDFLAFFVGIVEKKIKFLLFSINKVILRCEHNK